VRHEDVVNDDTVPQFGHTLREGSERAADAGAAQATSCPTCQAHFSPEGRFCPFDGTPLVAATGWDPSTDALLGVVVDNRYEVLSVIGEGGMGTVYEVRHRALGKRFALKALRKDLALDGEIAARFIQEARTAAAVSHPGLVEITDFGRLESDQVYFVMELLEGQSLASLLRNGGPMPAARGLAIVRQLVQAVKAAHDASIVHRDLKPDNIHIGRGDGDTDFVKVVDFGLAKVIGSSKLTRAGMVFGTPHYMSPEQAAGEIVDHRADIYALGIVMYEMFTGKVPFEADSYMGVLTKHLYMTPAPPSSLVPELKSLGALEEVILRCLQKRPEARYENLAALLAELDERLPRPPRSTPGAATPPRSLLADLELPSTPSPATPSRWAPVLGIASAFLVGAAIVMVLRGRASPPSVPLSLSVVTTPGPTRSATRPPAAATVGAAEGSPSVSSLPAASASSVPARKPATAPRAPLKPVPTAPKSAPTAKRPLGGGDIVDPWAR
jgi:eukaryotic-like serine/threonine-protein kinase